MSNIKSYMIKNDTNLSKMSQPKSTINNLTKIKDEINDLNISKNSNKLETVSFDNTFEKRIEDISNLHNRDTSIENQAKAIKEAKVLQAEKEILEDPNYSTYKTHIDRKTTQEKVNEEVDKKRQELINFANQYVGNKYVYGGTSLTDGIDCSGFTRAVYKEYGVDLPHNSSAQRNSGMKIEGLGNAKPGDLICFKGHVALYAGDGNIIHAANAKKGIVYEPLSAYWTNRIVTIVRPDIMV